MRDSNTGGTQSIQEIEKLHRRVAKLEQVNRELTGSQSPDSLSENTQIRWERTFDSIKDMIMVMDNEFKIVRANSAVSQFAGKPLKEIIGKTCCQIIHGKAIPPEGCPLKKAQSSRKHEEVELYVPEKDIWLEAAVDPIIDKSGIVSGAIHVIRDSTNQKSTENALRESEKRFRDVFDSTLVGLYRTTPDGRILMANPALVQMLGYASFEELAARNLEQEGFEPDYPRSQFKEQIEANGQIVGLESAWIRRDGTTLFVRESARAIRDSAGNTLYYQGAVEDITERKRAEEALQESEERYRSLFEGAEDHIFILDRDFRYLMVNPSALKAGSFTLEDVVGKGPREIFPEDAEFYLSQYRQTFETGKPVCFERELKLSDNSHWFSVTLSPIKDAKGCVIALTGISRDITDRRRAEEVLKESEQRFKTLFECAPDGIYLHDMNGTFVDGNKAAEEITGYKREELIGSNFTDTGLLPPEEVRKALAGLEKNRNGESTGPEEFTLIRKDGDHVQIEIRTFPVRIRDEILTLGIARDITERKKAEKAIKESEAQLKRAQKVAHVGSWFLDLKTSELIWSEETYRIFGVPVGRPLLEVDFLSTVHPDDLSYVKSSWAAALRGEPYDIEHRIVADGVVKWVHEKVELEFDDEGKPISGVGVVRDITERKQAEQALRNSEEKYRNLFENARDVIATFDTKGNITDANKAVEEYGFKREHIIGKSLFNYVVEEYRARAIEDFEKLIGGRSVHGEMDVITPKGTFTIEYSDNPIMSGGNVVGVQAILTDITERRRAGEAYRSLVDHSLQGLVIFQEGYVVFVNEAMARITGYTVDEMLTMSADEIRAFVHHEDRKMVWERHRQRLNGELPPEGYELRGICKDGSVRWLEIDACLIEYQGKPAIQAAYIDVTERRKAEEALRESEECFRGIFENSLLGLYRTTPDGLILMANPALVRMLGYTSYEELAERNLEQEGIETGYPRSRFKRRIEADGQVAGMESAWRKQDGTTTFFRESARAIRDEAGNTLYYQGAVEDITERKQAEDALRASEARFRAFVNHATDAFFLHGDKGIIVDVNQNACESLGYTREEFIGMTPCDFDVSVSQAFLEQLNVRLAAGEVVTFDSYHRRKDGTMFPVETRIRLFREEGRALAVSLVRDITERKRAEETLRESEQKYRELFENAREVIVIIDMDKRITDVNKFVEEYGFSKEDLIGRDYLDFIVEGYKEKSVEDFEKLRRGIPHEGEFEIITPKGNVTLYYRDNPIVRAGSVIGVQSVLTDITERKRAEEELHKYQVKLKAMASQILQTEERERQRIAVGLHDEICQKLVLSKFMLESSIKSLSDKNLSKSLRIISEAIGETICHAEWLTFELSNPVLREFGLITALKKYLYEEIRQKYGIAYDFHRDEKLGTLQDDIKNSLFRIIKELLMNIVKHAKAHKISVSMHKRHHKIHVRIQDDGVGFVIANVSSAFYEKKHFGLFSIREQLDHLGGSLNIESEPGRGTIVTIVLPLDKN